MSKVATAAPGFCRFTAACFIGVSTRTLDAMREEGAGPLHFVIGAEARYWPADLERHLAVTPEHAALAKIFRQRAYMNFDAHLELVPPPQARLSPRKVARALGVCERTLANWRNAGTGPTFLKTGNRIWYSGQDIREYIRYERQDGWTSPLG